MQVVTTPDCDCRRLDLYSTPFKAEFYSQELDAVRAFLDHVQSRDEFWSVHLNGAHLLNILP